MGGRTRKPRGSRYAHGLGNAYRHYVERAIGLHKENQRQVLRCTILEVV